MIIMITPQTLKGFRDFLPQSAIKRQAFITTIRTVFERFGFDPLETPALEYAETLLGKYGDEADKLLYLFKDNGNRNVGLRYDQTVPLARVIAQYPEIVKPFKRYQIQPVWRAENTQKGRYREFLQCDADIVGDRFAPTADAEILTLFWTVYNELGFKSFKVVVNSRSLLQYVFDQTFGAGTKKEIQLDAFLKMTRSLDKLSKIGEEGVITELIERGFVKNNVENLIQTINSLKKSTYKDLEKIDKNLFYSLQMTVENFKVPEDAIVFDPTMARGLDYYTGLIFEGLDSSYHGSLGGGGRYDRLIGQFIGDDISAVGFAIGFDRSIEVAEILKLLPSKLTNTKVLVAIIEDWENVFPTALNFVSLLRSHLINTELYLNPQEPRLDKQLKYADRKGIPYVAIIGPNEVANNTITLKSLKTHTQKSMSADEIVQFFQTKP